MAYKSIKVSVDNRETEITIRRIKKREFKDLIINIAKTADSFNDIASLADNNSVISAAPGYIEKNIEFICEEIIRPFTGLSREQLDEMDIIDILGLIKELIEYNGINIGEITNFFTKHFAANLNFGGIAAPSLG